MVSAPSVSALVSLGHRPTAEMVWRLDGGLIAARAGLLLCDRAALRPNVPAKNIRDRFQIIRNDDEQTLLATFRSKLAAEMYLNNTAAAINDPLYRLLG